MKTVADEMRELADTMHGHRNQTVGDVLRAAELLRHYGIALDSTVMSCAACELDRIVEESEAAQEERS
jgi:hypothetical protein